MEYIYRSSDSETPYHSSEVKYNRISKQFDAHIEVSICDGTRINVSIGSYDSFESAYEQRHKLAMLLFVRRLVKVEQDITEIHELVKNALRPVVESKIHESRW